MTDKTLREALREIAGMTYDSWTNGAKAQEIAERALASPEQAEPVTLCPCKDRAATACPGEWEPGCDLGNNPAHVRVSKESPDEVAATLRKVTAAQPAAPVGQTILESPWSVHDGGRYLAYEDDEPDDLIVRLDANWESDNQRLTFAEAIRDKLNATAPTAPAPATMVNGLTEAETNATASVFGLSTPPLPQGEKAPPPAAQPVALTGQAKLAAFGAWAAQEFRESLADVDGGSAQEAMERTGVIELFSATEPCGEGCICAEVSDFPQDCYRFAADVQTALASIHRPDGESQASEKGGA